MDPRTVARSLAYGRIGLGGGMLLAPGLVAALWAGRDGRRPAARLLTTGFGARDVAIGTGALVALTRGGEAAPWIRAGIAADVGDLVATARARRDIPALGALGVAAMAAAAAAAGAWAQRGLD